MKRNRVIVLIAAFVIAAGGIGTAAYSKASGTESDITYKETIVGKGNLVVGVTESGSVSIGNVEQTFELDSDSTSSGSSSSSSSTSNSSSANAMNGMQGSSGNTGSTGSSSSSTAALEVDTVYVATGQKISEGDAILKITDESIADYREELQTSVTSAELALKEAKLNAKSQQLSADYTYNSNVANGTVAESKYNVTISSLESAITKAQEAVTESQEKIADYETKIAAGEDLSTQLAQEQSNLTSLQAKLTSAQNDYTTKSIEAKQEYEEAMLNYNNASSILSIDTNGINDDVEDAQEALADAQELLAEFESTIGDGTIYSEYSGTIMSVGYAAGDILSSSTAVAAFADDTAVSIAVSVSQEDISAVTIGNEVMIQLTAYEDEEFAGKVSSMNTTTSSGSSTVSYAVTVLFTGDVSKIFADMTGEVTFVTKAVEDVTYVSNKAIINQGTKSYVDVKKEDGSIERREVTTGFSNGINVEIVTGLEEGETALIESQVSTS